MTASDVRLVFSTAPSPKVAATLARALVSERLCACVNRVDGVTSTYRWEGEVQEGAEVLLVIKTTEARIDALTARLVALHPYDCPEVVVTPVVGGAPAYLEWVRKSVDEVVDD